MIELIIALLLHAQVGLPPNLANNNYTIEVSNDLKKWFPNSIVSVDKYEYWRKVWETDEGRRYKSDAYTLRLNKSGYILVRCKDQFGISFESNGIMFLCARTVEEQSRAIVCDPKEANR